MFLLKGLLFLTWRHSYPVGEITWALGRLPPSKVVEGGRDGHSAGVPAPLLNSFTTRIAPHKWLWLSISRKNSQQSSKRPVHQQQHLAERKLEGEDCSSL